MGKNIKVGTTDGNYTAVAFSDNTYRSFNDSSAYGGVASTGATIENNITSNTKVISNADIYSNGAIDIEAVNYVTKNESPNYDLYVTTAGLLATETTALIDSINMTTLAELGGNNAIASGAYGDGYVTVFSFGKLDVSEKVDVDATGGVSVSTGEVSITPTINTKTNIKNRKIQTKSDDINFIANNDVNIYAKSNVEATGAVGGAGAKSYINNASITAAIDIASGVKSESMRDTYIQAICDKAIKAQVFAIASGAVTVGEAKVDTGITSNAKIIIEKGASISSYDAISLATLDNAGDLVTEKSSKGYIIGIPVHKESEGTVNNTSNTSIELYGSLESGIGAHRSLKITKNNKTGEIEIDADKMNAEKKIVGKITTEDIDEDIYAYETSKENELKYLNNLKEIEEQNIKNLNSEVSDIIKQIDDIISLDQKHTESINDANTLISNNDSISNIDTVVSSWNEAYNNTENTIDNNFGHILSSYDGDSNISSVITAYENYTNNGSDENLANLKTAIEDLNSIKATLQESSLDIAKNINKTSPNVDCTNNEHLAAFIKEEQAKINSNNSSLEGCNNAIDNIEANIQSSNDFIAKIDLRIKEVNDKYNPILTKLKDKKENFQSQDVYSYKVDDVHIRSGETSIVGNVTGNGSIKTSGNNFSIEVENDTLADVVFGDLIIDKNAVGGIILGENSSVSSTINKIVTNNSNAYTISIKNNLDANDPNIGNKGVDTGNGTFDGYGDLVFEGVVDNLNGDVIIQNDTNNILTSGGINAKNIVIAAIYGEYIQKYSDGNTEYTPVGGYDSEGHGAIIALGNIDIYSQIINVNSLIQSGTEIKSISIPDFKVVYDRNTGKYYQEVNGTRTVMKQGSTSDCYYLNITGNGEDVTSLQAIKAYFKVTENSDADNVQGEIQLFNAKTGGGNISLTGNIVNSSENGNGRIVLMEGYGHIDIENNSNYVINTNGLDASTYNSGNELKIIDFYYGGSDHYGINFLASTTEERNPRFTKGWCLDNGVKYSTASVRNGRIDASTSYGVQQVDYEAKWENRDSSDRSDNAKLYTVDYMPADDAYYIEYKKTDQNDKFEQASTYEQRSWWTEAWQGKTYKTEYAQDLKQAGFELGRNPIKVTFQGFDKPEINVISKSSIAMNKSIDATGGDINLTSTNGSISFNHANKSLMADNIKINAVNGNIGNSSGLFIQTDISDGGSLVANAKNIAIDMQTNKEFGLEINADEMAYIRALDGDFTNSTKKMHLNAPVLQILANDGSIDINEVIKNGDTKITTNELNLSAKNDITVTTKNDTKVGVISSDSKNSKISLTSEYGSIVASDSADYQYISGGNVVLSAINGYIGSQDKALRFVNNATFDVTANNDIYITSSNIIRADIIKSIQGSVNLDAKYGIVTDKSTSTLSYNIASAGDVNLNTAFGNIENIGINADGTINASAGYFDDNPSGISDILIYLRSKEELKYEDVKDKTPEELANSTIYNEYATGIKDMKIGTVRASKQVSIYAEGSLLNADSNSSIKAEYATISAAKGDLGTAESPIKLETNRFVSAFAGDKGNVYLTAVKDLKIDTIQSTSGGTDSNATLSNVVINTTGDIINSSQNNKNSNIVADNIELNAQGDIGSIIKHITVSTTSKKLQNGLKYTAQNAYINGIDKNLNVVSANTLNNSSILSDNDIIIQSAAVGGRMDIAANGDLKAIGLDIAGDLSVSSKNATIAYSGVGGNVDIATSGDLDAYEIWIAGDLSVSSKNAIIENNYVGGDADIIASGDLNIKNSEITGDLSASSQNSTIEDSLVGKNTKITSRKKAKISNSNLQEDLFINAPIVEIDNIDSNGTLNSEVDKLTVNSKNDVKLGTIKGNTKDYAENVKITTDKSILNAKNDDTPNIAGKNIDLKAGENIGSTDKPINIKLTKKNKVKLDAPNSIAVSVDGAPMNISNATTKDLTLNANNDINIDKLDVDKIKLTTKGNKLIIDNMIINDSGSLNVGNNNIVIDNSTMQPIIDADVQLKLVNMPTYIKVIGNNVSTDERNLIKNSGHIILNGGNTYSMGDAAVLSLETALKNSKVIDKTIEKTDSLVYYLPNEKRYKNNYYKRYTQGIIRNQIDEIVTPLNAFSVINLSNASDEDDLVYNKISSL